MAVPTESHELTQVSPVAKGSKARGEDISQREYEDRIQLMRLGKKPALKVRFELGCLREDIITDIEPPA